MEFSASVTNRRKRVSGGRRPGSLYKISLFLILLLCAMPLLCTPGRADDAPESTGYAVPLDDSAPLLRTASLTTTTAPTPEEAYARMLAMKEEYPEEMLWTNDNFYDWNGGIYSRGYGCAGFAFLLSDAAFGDLPARMLTSFSYDDLQSGDILRINGDTHSVIILQKFDDHVVIAEGNYNSSIHWFRELSKSQVLAADYVLTRYPANYLTLGDFVFEIHNGRATIAEWNGAESDTTVVTIPETINDCPVVGIGNEAFMGKNIASVLLPACLEEIGDQAFYDSNIRGTVSIPASVASIGTYAFSYMWNVEAFEVATENTAYCTVDGVLYSKDMTVLYNYPMQKAGASFTVPEEVGLLYCTSFAYARNLEELYVNSRAVRAMTYTFYGDDFTVWCYPTTELYAQLTEGSLETDVACSALQGCSVSISGNTMTVLFRDRFDSAVSLLAAYDADGRMLALSALQSDISNRMTIQNADQVATLKLFLLNSYYCPEEEPSVVWTRTA